MSSKAEVREQQQKTKEPDTPDAKWLAHAESELDKIDAKEHKTTAEIMWERGKWLFEVRRRFRYRQGFVEWVKNRRKYKVATAYNHINIYIACPRPELLEYLPLWLLRMIGSSNFPDEVRTYIQDNAERLRKDITEKELRELADKVKMIGLDKDDPDVKRLLDEREKRAKKSMYRKQVDTDLNDIANKWKVFDSAARAGLTPDPDDDGIVGLTEEQEEHFIVGKLKELGYRLEYKLVVETDVSND
jgi:hypothetical protein